MLTLLTGLLTEACSGLTGFVHPWAVIPDGPRGEEQVEPDDRAFEELEPDEQEALRWYFK